MPGNYQMHGFEPDNGQGCYTLFVEGTLLILAIVIFLLFLGVKV